MFRTQLCSWKTAWTTGGWTRSTSATLRMWLRWYFFNWASVFKKSKLFLLDTWRLPNCVANKLESSRKTVNSFQCYPISWFLAVDMQLYCIAPFFLIAIFYSSENLFFPLASSTFSTETCCKISWVWGRSGIISMVGGALLSFGTIISLTAHYDLPVMTTTTKSVGKWAIFFVIFISCQSNS